MRPWLDATFFDESSPLHNPDHAHLPECDLEFLWAASGFDKGMRRVIGQAEQVQFQSGGWKRRRQEEQFEHWFGRVPAFVITLDSEYCSQCSDVEWCALVDHELYHIAQALDAFGAPKFGRDGKPQYAIRGHDVEEFIGVVARYGVGQPDGQVARMVEAAKRRPSIAPFSVAHACGTCVSRVA
ncbi:hypothetical protein G7Y82_04615 [Solimonas sp. C16B3]|uniref:Putative phage metallopeptidase domain-containing protein n=1 Tax=Solimonas marina TaxID=2714601 RepID=A0A970B5I0_9GAMM|nr:hypothetical protein [Solimonas marina]